jgi:hypothetical protein
MESKPKSFEHNLILQEEDDGRCVVILESVCVETGMTVSHRKFVGSKSDAEVHFDILETKLKKKNS